MILRSVVGKLWLTIIILVTLILVLLSLFLSEQIENSYVEGQRQSLEKLATRIQTQLKEAGPNQTQYLNNVLMGASEFGTYLVVLDASGSVSPIGVSPHVPNVQWREILTDEELKKVLKGQSITMRGKVRLQTNPRPGNPLLKNDILLVAVPYIKDKKPSGAIVLYQVQDHLSEADIKRWIFYTFLIGIVLTTIFAFFLSSRISQPLIQMKRAVEKMARGEFSTRVPVRYHERDEIAELAMTFNRLASQLEDTIHQLSQEKEQLASILRSMSDGVLTINKFGKIIMTNPIGEGFLSLWRGEVKKNALPPSLQALFNKVIEDTQEHTGDISEHGRTWVVMMSPLYAGDQVRGVVAVLRDVTEERRLDKLRKDFVANVSHELRTPLAMLQGYSEALLDDIAETPEERREIAQVINEESQRMGRLVRELLDLARMEAGHIQVEPAEKPLDKFVQRVIRKFQNLAREQEVRLEADLAEHLPTVFWDEDKIEQVLTNLVDNAIRHTPTGGSVTVHVHQKGERIFLEVEDTGSGIPEEDVPFVFERFYKADKARTRGKSGGTGLGLSIVKHLVTAHGGNVSVKSQLGVGTVFIVELPVRVADEVLYA
ncbi:PAS domain-containing sensor histidine kinase [Laceyella sacchari]|uniref:histidine kinase n=1 Tax=Laceyella tengchongensis TaxID=574699 RepID=A0AA46AFP2_9BACL|nr:ATP-binding protein [Laceyella tengchongensis]AUS08664.1 PAS domain-containing sensor histidine kinase [Laceyella sacchari]SMP20935.1 two-component system, OmpR family, sensor histidine kinase ResE [Laceyella tengchongensis]